MDDQRATQTATSLTWGPEWVRRLRVGDEAAFEDAFRTYAPALCAFAFRYVGSRAVAEDLVQDLFLTIWRKREELDITGAVGSYLYTATRNRALNHLQREQAGERFRVALLERLDASMSAGEEEMLTTMEMQRALDELPERCGLIFRLSRQEGMTYAEIAASLGLSVKTVETQMGRALKRLRDRLLRLRR
jgi:RNA polymerase sigma-70 factor, ECF subfamily